MDAGLIVNDNGELVVLHGTKSVEVDVDATTDAVIAALTSGAHSVSLDITRTSPAISDEQASAAKDLAEHLTGAGLTLTWGGKTYQLSPSQLLASLTITTDSRAKDPITLGFSPEVITSLLGPIADGINVPVKDIQLRFVNGKIKVVGQAKKGREVDVKSSVAAAIDAGLGAKGTVPLVVKDVEPTYTSVDVSKISLKDVLGEASTYYGTSTEAKQHNIDRAAELENGWMVAPDGIFSYDANIGDVTEKNGFVTGLGIVADPSSGGIMTAPVVGGGICQVSTTIFQAAFWAGMKVEERYSHPYWIRTYGEPPSGMLGLDAMVDIEDQGSLDMQFRNTTGNWIAVVLSADEENVSVKILGKDPGWTVKIDGPEITNVVQPPTDTIVQDSPELPAGDEKQVESAQDGFDASIRRVITDKKGEVIDDYTLASTYVPSRNRILRGTGTSS